MEVGLQLQLDKDAIATWPPVEPMFSAASPSGVQLDVLGRPGTVRALIELFGRHLGSLVCRKWLQVSQALPLTAREEKRLVQAVVTNHWNQHFLRDLGRFRITTLVLRLSCPHPHFQCNPFHGHACFLDSVTDVSVAGVMERCPHLTAIDLSDCWRITDATVDKVRLLADHGRHLLSLKLGSRSFASTHPTDNRLSTQPVITKPVSIGDASLYSVVTAGCSRLATLELFGCHMIHDHALVALADCCRQLTGLTIRSCRALTDDSVIAVGEHCKDLTSFRLEYSTITDDAIVSLANGCRKLTTFHLEQCPRITDVSVITLVTKAAGLKVFSLSGNKHVGERGFAALAEEGSGLTHVRLDQCQGLTYGAIASLATATGCPNLVKLRFCTTSVKWPDSSLEMLAALKEAYPHVKEQWLW